MTWYENQTLWREVRPYLFPEQSFDDARSQVEGILSLSGLQEPRVLDLPCGPGRHAIEFAKRGCDVVGVDLETTYVDETRQLFEEQGLPGTFVVDDIRDFRSTEPFDLVVNFFSSFGYFDSEIENRRAAATFAENLRPGGILVLDSISLEFICANFQSNNALSFDDGTFLIERRKLSPDFRLLDSTWTLILADGRRHEFSFQMRLYSAAELSALLRSVGFSHIDVFGDLSGSAFSTDGRLVIRAVR